MNYQSETDFLNPELSGKVVAMYCVIADQNSAECVVCFVVLLGFLAS